MGGGNRINALQVVDMFFVLLIITARNFVRRRINSQDCDTGGKYCRINWIPLSFFYYECMWRVQNAVLPCSIIELFAPIVTWRKVMNRTHADSKCVSSQCTLRTYAGNKNAKLFKTTSTPSKPTLDSHKVN